MGSPPAGTPRKFGESRLAPPRPVGGVPNDLTEASASVSPSRVFRGGPTDRRSSKHEQGPRNARTTWNTPNLAGDWAGANADKGAAEVLAAYMEKVKAAGIEPRIDWSSK